MQCGEPISEHDTYSKKIFFIYKILIKSEYKYFKYLPHSYTNRNIKNSWKITGNNF